MSLVGFQAIYIIALWCWYESVFRSTGSHVMEELQVDHTQVTSGWKHGNVRWNMTRCLSARNHLSVFHEFPCHQISSLCFSAGEERNSVLVDHLLRMVVHRSRVVKISMTCEPSDMLVMCSRTPYHINWYHTADVATQQVQKWKHHEEPLVKISRI